MPVQTALPALIEAPPEERLGPAMLALTENRRRFVTAMLETGGTNYSRCAELAGYGGTDNARRVAGHRLAHDPAVLAAVREEADRRIQTGAILAGSALLEIAGDVLHKDRFKAAVELLNRAGLITETRHRVTVEDNRTTAELEQQIVALAQKNGIDPKTLLGYTPGRKLPVVEAEFVEMSAEGLEDVL